MEQTKVKTLFRILMLSLVVGLMLGSCSGSEDEADSDPVSQDPCANLSVEDFDQFLGVKYGTKELLLQDKLGNFTGGEYTADSSAFIYRFNRIERVPLSVWVNATTGKVITIFMEVLSLEQNFESDLAKAKEEFNMSECDASWFGMTAKEIKNRMGEPAEEAISNKGVTLLSYDSESYLYTVAFKMYPEQDSLCSSVSVNWFY